MIPRALVAEALGLPGDTDALPPGDLPLDRFVSRLIGYLQTPDADAQTPDAWTGAVMDRLIAEDPDLALDALEAGADHDGSDVLLDPLLDLLETAGPEIAERIAEADLERRLSGLDGDEEGPS